ncbi:MAG TPA: flagellar hook-basal body complex protein FliE [Candidatus Babeliales bacterium]|nr:flagellar hook-basal body complex protein FliE [Candidatus Babeliales bacterium]
MRVEPLIPDAPAAPVAGGDTSAFAKALDAVGGLLGKATRAEDDFAYGRGSLLDAVYERARADVALSVATSAAQRLVQAVQSVLNMQV